MRSPVSRLSIWQVGVDVLLVAGAWWLAWSLRFEQRPVYYDRYLDWSIVPSWWSQAAGVRVVRLLQPVVALRLDPRHVDGRARVALASIAVFLAFTPSTSTA